MNAYQNLYGLLAEFDSTESLLEATRRVRAGGFTRVDAFAPFPVEGIDEALGFTKTRMPLLVLAGGLIGCAAGYGMQWYLTVKQHPLNIGGRPLHSWPAFIPVTFELTILAAALFAVLGMLALNGLPRPHHPLFEVEAFARASRDGYFLCVESSDPQFDAGAVRKLFEESGAKEVWDVPAVD